MGFYDLKKEERADLVVKIGEDLLADLENGTRKKTLNYFSDDDTYIRKSAYLCIGRIYKTTPSLKKLIIKLLDELAVHPNEKIRQTVVNVAGEIGMKEFDAVEKFMERGLFDEHPIVRNAVIGSIKKMGEKNPQPVLKFSKRYLAHEDKEIRREICHGIELRGRTHPQDILPLLRKLQYDKTSRVRNTLVHVLGQIAYKKGCLETVVEDLRLWENKELVMDALDEIVDVHDRYRNFAVKTQKEAIKYISLHFT